MALYRRTVTVLGCFAANLLRATGRTRHRLVRLPPLIRRNWITLGISGAGLCAVPFVQDKLSHEDFIRKASSLVTDSANTYLSRTTMALVDSLNQYTNTIQSLINLHKKYVANISKLNPTQEDKVWQTIVSKRQEVIEKREGCKTFETHWDTAFSLAELAAEAAFNAGLDVALATVQNNMQIAKSHVEKARKRSLEAEKEMEESKAGDSERLQLATQEEEEIPEAYLRED